VASLGLLNYKGDKEMLIIICNYLAMLFGSIFLFNSFITAEEEIYKDILSLLLTIFFVIVGRLLHIITLLEKLTG
jgi:prepilin signal peptidase PulO-like enzyme (type II secretory pathway)